MLHLWRINIDYDEKSGCRVRKTFTVVTDLFEHVNSYALEKIADVVSTTGTSSKVLKEVNILQICEVDRLAVPTPAVTLPI